MDSLPSESSSVAETAGAALSGPKLVNLDQLSARDRRDNELCYALLGFNRDGMLTKVDQDDFDLAAIIGVDGARRIHQREPFVECAATSGPHLPLEPGRYFDCNSGRDGGTGQRCKDQWFVERRMQINARGMLALITRRGRVQALNFDNRNNQELDEPRWIGARNGRLRKLSLWLSDGFLVPASEVGV
jgi:hypothetical protein